MFKFLLLFIALQANPTVVWKSEFQKAPDGGNRIVLTGDVADGVDHISGTLDFMTCIGTQCNMPEEWEFADSLKAGQASSASVTSNPEGTSGISASGPEVRPSVQSSGGGKGTSGLEPIWSLILEAILWGFAMLLTPCVFPMVPMTISFFMKGSDSPVRGRFKAFMYGLFIVLLYTVPICIIIGITWAIGGSGVTADIFNWLSTNWLPNILFFLVFIAFAFSFFGAFEITLPSSWTNGADKKSDRKGLGGVFFLALTLVLVSFSCTGPIVGTVLIKSTQGEFWAPMVTMLAFSIAFALPFAVLAMFPSLISKLPKSGGWLNSVKVLLGFIELALSLKFLSTADQAYHWHILNREVYLAIWIVVFTLMGFYLLGKIRFKYDSPVAYLSVKRLILSIITFSFVLYLVPGLWGAPLKEISGYLPPIESQSFVLGGGISSDMAPSAAVPDSSGRAENIIKLSSGLEAYDNLDAGMAAARRDGKRIFVDITGYGCVNCREMEMRVWSAPEVLRMLKNDFVIVALYVDDKSKLPESKWVANDSGKMLKEVGRVNSNIAMKRFGVNSEPSYFILDADGRQIAGPYAYDLDISSFVNFLSSR